ADDRLEHRPKDAISEDLLDGGADARSRRSRVADGATARSSYQRGVAGFTGSLAPGRVLPLGSGLDLAVRLSGDRDHVRHRPGRIVEWGHCEIGATAGA